MRFTVDRLDDLLQGEGWEAEFGRDVWLLRRLGYPRGSGPARLRFDRVDQPWLCELVKELGPLAAVGRAEHPPGGSRRGRADLTVGVPCRL